LAGEVDPEVAELLGFEEDGEAKPDFRTLIGEEQPEAQETVDLNKDKFTPIVKVEEKPKPLFQDKQYYKKLLVEFGETGRKVHTLITQFIGAKDGQDRSLFRSRLMPAVWDLETQIAERVRGGLSTEKRLLLRYGILSPTFLSREQREMISRVILENNTGEPVHYVDEWMEKISTGAVTVSATDEVKIVRKDSAQRQVEIIEKRKGQKEAELSLVRNKISEREALERRIAEDVKSVVSHQEKPGYTGLKDVYSPTQRKTLGGIPDSIRKAINMDREIARSFAVLEKLDQEIDDLASRTEGADAADVDTGDIRNEFNTVRQMAKMCVGRQGNHFNVLMKNYLRSNIKDICTRENVINEMAAIESLDPGVFERSFKGQTNRIVPHVILIPCYGDQGICWEPFERYNKATSRGRIAVPMYPKNVKAAVISAVADLRWQVAKEKAQHYWMEEGITGRYYQWFQDNRLKGDVKDAFIGDYILWITKESAGTQKLDREVRGIFWRMMPFPQPIKDNLKNRGFVYNELYKKDSNIALSDGY